MTPLNLPRPNQRKRHGAIISLHTILLMPHNLSLMMRKRMSWKSRRLSGCKLKRGTPWARMTLDFMIPLKTLKDRLMLSTFHITRFHRTLSFTIICSDLAELTSQSIEPLPQDKHSLIRHLEKASPETLALARDWGDTARNLMKY